MPFSRWHTSIIRLMATLSASGASDPFADFLNLAPTSLSNLEVSPPFESEDLPICCHTEDTLLDDSTRVHFGHRDIGTVVCRVDGVLVLQLDFVTPICLESVQVHLIPNLTDHIDVFLSPLPGIRCHLSRRRPLLSVPGTFGIQVFT